MRIKKVALGNSEEAYIEESFTDGINVVFSNDNNKGKTIVMQSILYAIGNKPIFPNSFDYKKYYYYVEFEENNINYVVVRRGDSYIVSSSSTGLNIFENASEFKRFWETNIFNLPHIIHRGNKRTVDMELFSQLFFVGQDGKDTSDIFNSGFYRKDDFKAMIYSFAGDAEKVYSADDINSFKEKIRELKAKRKEQLQLSVFYKTSTPAKEYLSRIKDQDAFQNKVHKMDKIMDQISDIRKKRSMLATKKSLWGSTLTELRSLNRTIEVGELYCMDCNSNRIAYKGKGKITYSFDVSTTEMRNKIIKSINNKISAYEEEIEKLDYEITGLQKQIEETMKDEDVTVENILAYKNGFNDITEIEAKVKAIDDSILKLNQKLKTNDKQTNNLKSNQQIFYNKIIGRMNQIKHLIDKENNQDYEDIFTKRGSVISGSEATVYYISRSISIAELTHHSCPIIMDSFRAEDLSTEKENIVLHLLSEMNRQCILTTTLKAEENDKYADMTGINAINYSSYQSNKILNPSFCPKFRNLLESLGISLEQ